MCVARAMDAPSPFFGGYVSVGIPCSLLHSTPPHDGMFDTTTATCALTRPSSMAACSARRLLPPPETNTATLPLGFVSAVARAATRRARVDDDEVFFFAIRDFPGRRLEQRRACAVMDAVDILTRDTNRRVGIRTRRRAEMRSTRSPRTAADRPVRRRVAMTR